MITKEIDISSIEIEDIKYWDYPDFVDAFVSKAFFKDGEELTEEELQEINEDMEFLNDLVLRRIF